MDNEEAAAEYPLDDLSWMKPYVEEARASVRLRNVLSLGEHRRRMKERLADAGKVAGLGGFLVEVIERKGR